jgi:hypothetical protein
MMSMRWLLLLPLLLGMFSPPAGRPPVGPLQRYEPKAYDMTFTVALSTVQQNYAPDRQAYVLDNAPIIMPVIFLGTFSRVDSDSVTAKLWLDAREDQTATQRMEIISDMPMHTNLARFTVQHFEGPSLRWQLGYHVQVWNSRMDEKVASALEWPQEWPDEVKDALKPQKYIESGETDFHDFVENVTHGRLKSAAPYFAAKELVRAAIAAMQTNGDGVDHV